MPEHSLESLGLVDAPAEPAYDNLALLAARIIDTPIALVSIVQPEKDRQFFKSQLGMPEPWASRRETPLSHSFCRHVVATDATLVVEDAHVHPVLAGNPAIAELGVVAYLGTPVRLPFGVPVGALCVVDGRPRRWRDADVRNLECLARCVTDAIRLQSSLNASEALRAEQMEFSYALSHDLRSPIDSLRALLAELGRDDPPALDADQRQLLAVGRRTIDRAATLVDDVHGYARSIERDLACERVQLDEVVATVREDLAAVIERTGAEFDIAALPSIDGNRVQLHMLVQNLIGNALKYHAPGVAPRVSIVARRDGTHVELVIADEGFGIAPEHHERVFELFRRVRVSEECPGSGLGLAVCRRIASNHGGTIRLRSVPGEGAEFVVRLPQAA